MVYRSVMIIFFVVLSPMIHAQYLTDYPSLMDHYLIRNLGVDEGIKGIQVNEVVQDDQGFLWILTSAEFSRFDGLRFRDRKTPEMTGTIYDMFMDGPQSAWVTVFGSGLFRYAGDSLTIVPQIQDDRIKSVVASTEGIVFAGSYGNGLYRLNNDSSVTHFTTEDGLISDEIWKLELMKNGELWIATNSGLSIFDGKSFHNFNAENGLSGSAVRSIGAMDNGEVWVGTNGGGITLFRDRLPVNTLTERDGLSGSIVYDIAQSPEDGSVWIAYQGEKGVDHYLDGTITPIDASDGLISSQVNDIFFARDGEIVISTESGISILVPRKFGLLSVPGEGILEEESVLVNQTTDGVTWIGSWSNGYRYLKKGKWGTLESPADITNGQTQSSTITADGQIWFGTQGSGIIRVQNEQIAEHITSQDGLSDDYIRGLTPGENGNLWVCTNKGINLLNEQRSVIRVYDETVLPNSFCTTILRSEAGDIWAGTFGGGVVQITKDDSLHLYNAETGLELEQVISLYEDSKGGIWVGTLGNGLYLIKDRKITVLDHLTGIPEANYAGFLEDMDGNFWLPTGNGLLKTRLDDFYDFMDGAKAAVPYQLFVKEDGMLTDNFQTANNSTASELDSGQILFATISGTVVVDPEISDLSGLRFFPYIDEIVAGDTTFTPDEEIRLSPGNNKIQITYSALNLGYPHKTQFRTRLKGIENDWSLMENRSTAFYDYLPDGSYTMEVSATGPDGQWSPKIATVDFTVLPPFYRTSWFLALCLITFTGMIAGAVQIRSNAKVRRLNRELMLQQRIQNERERISRDLHDNVGSQITNLITGIEISNMHLQNKQSDEAILMMKSLDTDARNTMTDLRETIWLLDKEEVSLQIFCEHLKGYISRQKPYLKGLNVIVDCPDNLNLVLKPTESLNLMRIIQEALNNTRKYADATQFEVQIRKFTNTLKIIARDNGKGLKSGSKDRGNGLLNMEERAGMIDAGFDLTSAPSEGVCITIELPIA